jgi:signal transduction histidine kinase
MSPTHIAAAPPQDKQSELSELNAKLSAAQDQLVQSEKLASIGQLAAGVAHEINNPIGYIFSNFSTLERYLGQLFQMLEAYEAAEPLLADGGKAQALRSLRQHIELDYLKEDIPNLMRESREGISRVRKIVSDLKDFSRPGASQEWVWTNLLRGVDSTLNIVSNELKYKADVVLQLQPLPDVECLPSEINQVLLNLLVNAAHAIRQSRGTITVRTGQDHPDTVWLEVEDDGCGIAREHIGRIFDPFFTTKPVGQGTGLGLSLSYGIIQKHNGRIDVRSEPGTGSCFRVTLPVQHAAAGEQP